MQDRNSGPPAAGQEMLPGILVIDDDEMVLETVSAVLRSAGYRVTTALNGEAGLVEFARNRVDVVITDIIMPIKEGIETIAEFRRRYPEIKIIAMSGGGRWGNLDYLRMAKKFGADAIISKPFTGEAVLQLVEDLAGCAG